MFQSPLAPIHHLKIFCSLKWCHQFFNLSKIKKIKEKGQTLIEFVLLLLVVTSLSYLMVSQLNRIIATSWEKTINLLLHPEDPNTKTAIMK